MKSAIISIIFFNLISLSHSWAGDCQRALLAGEVDSNSFFVSEEYFEKGMDEDQASFAAQAIADIRQRVGCSAQALVSSQVNCRNVIEQDESSKVCVAMAPEGMYFIVADFLGNARVILNRWD